LFSEVLRSIFNLYLSTVPNFLTLISFFHPHYLQSYNVLAQSDCPPVLSAQLCPRGKLGAVIDGIQKLAQCPHYSISGSRISDGTDEACELCEPQQKQIEAEAKATKYNPDGN